MSLQDKITALMVASMHGHVEVAKLLLGAGANVNASDTLVSLQQWHCSLGICSQTSVEILCTLLAVL